MKKLALAPVAVILATLNAHGEAAGRMDKDGNITTYYAPDGSVIGKAEKTDNGETLTIYSTDGAVLGRYHIPLPEIILTDPDPFRPVPVVPPR
jgi:hypothetical protein